MSAALIFTGLIFLIMMGVPIAIALGAVSLVAMSDNLPALGLMAQRMYSSTTGFTLLAIPFFILAGNLMNTGGITEKIFRFAKASVSHYWGGLGQVNIFASMIFSGMSGAAVADAAGLGKIEVKAMVDDGYDPEFAGAVTAASSTIGPVVPPSIPFVIYGSLTGVSVGKLFLAGMVPGVLMAIAMAVAVNLISRKRNYPRRPKAGYGEWWASFKDAILALLTPIIIIGGILGGWFTPTEAAVIACIYALLLSTFVYRELTWKKLLHILEDTLLHTVRVMFIMATAGFFGWVLTLNQVPQTLVSGLTTITQSPALLMLIMIGVLLILGMFLEGIAVILICVPIFIPVVNLIGMDPIQFGVVMILASMIGLLSPPVGMCLYAVASISNVKVTALSKEVLPYILGIFIVLLMVAFIPAISLTATYLIE
ncbi:tripartite ATP-independent transporter DctM subunit [Aliiruegeria haliotis]|uniref:TRAP transporter large permease protein n=1 Tax=Aliiruegeria haliotis TaxID=1280846 RepID=A0A2T0RHM1_9RHOB|nr:TRAP transporter large permease [Aliiruegeria haliotis]PRY20631.1 tripartite ATP-independent transporter DctM subunit [Aliiruegeria haliotis]